MKVPVRYSVARLGQISRWGADWARLLAAAPALPDWAGNLAQSGNAG